MHIGKDDLLAGVPAKRLRDVLIKMDTFEWSRKHLQKELGLKPVEAAGILTELVAEGYIEQAGRLKGSFRAGQAAPRLVNVRFIKRIYRAKADALVAGLIQRAKDINADKRFVLHVVELQAFGSYLDPTRTDLGDVDVAFDLKVKPMYENLDVTEQSKLTERYFPDVPQRNFLSFLYLPRNMVLRTLKNRSPYISLHPLEDLAKIGTTGRTIYSMG